MKRTFGLIMVGIYLFIGVFLLVIGWNIITPLQNKGLGILLILYAAFRAYREYYSARLDREEDDESPNQHVHP